MNRLFGRCKTGLVSKTLPPNGTIAVKDILSESEHKLETLQFNQEAKKKNLLQGNIITKMQGLLS